MTRAADGAAVVTGHLPAGLRPGGLGQLRVPAIERKTQPKLRQPVTARPNRPGERAMPAAGDTCEIAEYGVIACLRASADDGTQIGRFWGSRCADGRGPGDE